MSWNVIQSLFDGQGVVFWAAISAVTLGLTMLSVSIVFQVRKIVAGKRFGFKRNRGHSAQPVSPAAEKPQITVTEDGYKAQGFLPTPTLASDGNEEGANPLMDSLLERLKTSADHLESIHASLNGSVGSRSTAPDSSLKPNGEGVDYIYRAGKA